MQHLFPNRRMTRRVYCLCKIYKIKPDRNHITVTVTDAYLFIYTSKLSQACHFPQMLIHINFP